jgi:dihydrofolate reductase
MSKVILSITMSLDGFIAGPDISEENPLGIGGPILHRWLFDDKQKEDELILEDFIQQCGAVILGSRTYTTAIDGAWGGKSPFKVPAFILSHSSELSVREGFTCINNGIESALFNASVAAGGKNIWIMGGANVAQQYFYEGMLDELHLHIAPVILGNGTHLFKKIEFEQTQLIKFKTIETKGASHLFFKFKA